MPPARSIGLDRQFVRRAVARAAAGAAGRCAARARACRPLRRPSTSRSTRADLRRTWSCRADFASARAMRQALRSMGAGTAGAAATPVLAGALAGVRVRSAQRLNDTATTCCSSARCLHHSAHSGAPLLFQRQPLPPAGDAISESVGLDTALGLFDLAQTDPPQSHRARCAARLKWRQASSPALAVRRTSHASRTSLTTAFKQALADGPEPGGRARQPLHRASPPAGGRCWRSPTARRRCSIAPAPTRRRCSTAMETRRSTRCRRCRAAAAGAARARPGVAAAGGRQGGRQARRPVHRQRDVPARAGRQQEPISAAWCAATA